MEINNSVSANLPVVEMINQQTFQMRPPPPYPAARGDLPLYSFNSNSATNTTSLVPSPTLPTTGNSPVGAVIPANNASQNCDNNSTISETKPPLSYIAILANAIQTSETGKILLREIYKYMTSKYPYYKKCKTNWRNSVRHSLTYNQCFVKIPRKPNEPGKGDFWTLHPDAGNMFENGGYLRRQKRFKDSSKPNRKYTRRKTKKDNNQTTPPNGEQTPTLISTASSGSYSEGSFAPSSQFATYPAQPLPINQTVVPHQETRRTNADNELVLRMPDQRIMVQPNSTQTVDEIFQDIAEVLDVDLGNNQFTPPPNEEQTPTWISTASSGSYSEGSVAPSWQLATDPQPAPINPDNVQQQQFHRTNADNELVSRMPDQRIMVQPDSTQTVDEIFQDIAEVLDVDLGNNQFTPPPNEEQTPTWISTASSGSYSEGSVAPSWQLATDPQPAPINPDNVQQQQFHRSNSDNELVSRMPDQRIMVQPDSTQTVDEIFQDIAEVLDVDLGNNQFTPLSNEEQTPTWISTATSGSYSEGRFAPSSQLATYPVQPAPMNRYYQTEAAYSQYPGQAQHAPNFGYVGNWQNQSFSQPANYGSYPQSNFTSSATYIQRFS